MGFIIIAKGRQNIFIACELAWAVVSLCLAWVCISAFGLNGAGIAFFGSYVFHAFLMYPIVRRLSGFRWSQENARCGLLLLGITAIVFLAFYVLPYGLAFFLGAVALICSCTYSIRVIASFVPRDLIPGPIRKILFAFGPVRHKPQPINLDPGQ
jgi:PST family polysaccharide transporter